MTSSINRISPPRSSQTPIALRCDRGPPDRRLPSSPQVETPIALLIGVISGLIVPLSSLLLAKLEIDDAIGAFPVHGACGAWGVLAAGLFDLDMGWWTGHHFDDAFGPNVVGIICIAAWAVFCCAPLFFILKKVNLLRVSEAVEYAGLDNEFALQRQR